MTGPSNVPTDLVKFNKNRTVLLLNFWVRRCIINKGRPFRTAPLQTQLKNLT